MRPRRPSPEHEQAVARRLALLSAELAAVRAEQGVGVAPDDGPRPAEPSWARDHTRIRGVEEASDGAVPDAVEVATGPLPASLPLPGRHAARRAEQGGWLPAGLRGRVALQPAHLAVVAVLVAVALAWTTWWVVAGEPRTTALPPAGTVTPDPAAPSPVAATVTPPGAAEVVVDVAGRVRRPGLVVLPAGSRVADALAEAGGARRGVDLTSLNLARPLVDGEQLLVDVPTPAGAGLPAPPGVPAAPPGGLVNLNTADEALLDTLPGVGPVTAAAIVAWRSEHGGFTSVDELLEVNGIGEVTLAELQPLVTV